MLIGIVAHLILSSRDKQYMFADDIKVSETILGKKYRNKFKELYPILNSAKQFLYIFVVSHENEKRLFPNFAFAGKIFLTKKTADTGEEEKR